MPIDMHRASRSARAGLRSLADFIWPARSILTSERHGGQGVISAQDFTRLHFLSSAGCRMCAMPMEVDLGADSVCGACLARPPRWDQARAALAYDDASRQAILDLKYSGRRDGLTVMANWMTLAGQDVLDESDLIVPVPLHYGRLARRGFNQAGWLAQKVAGQTGLPMSVDALVRCKATPSQGGLTGRQRRQNVSGAFAVRKSRLKRVEGARITLVDDVYTTGSTLSACSLTLKRAGAISINVLVLARVVREKDITI